MKTPCIVISAVFVLTQMFSTLCPGQENGERLVRQVSNWYLGEEYVIRVSEKQLAKAPKWTGKEENPPLSVSRAMLAARGTLEVMFPEAGEWLVWTIRLERTSLEHHWMYVVAFDPTPPVSMGKLWPPFHVVVLMDGKVPCIERLKASEAGKKNIP